MQAGLFWFFFPLSANLFLDISEILLVSQGMNKMLSCLKKKKPTKTKTTELWSVCERNYEEKYAEEVASARAKERQQHNTAQFLKYYLILKYLGFVFLFQKDELLEENTLLIFKLLLLCAFLVLCLPIESTYLILGSCVILILIMLHNCVGWWLIDALPSYWLLK